jgi:hypothetical protein
MENTERFLLQGRPLLTVSLGSLKVDLVEPYSDTPMSHLARWSRVRATVINVCHLVALELDFHSCDDRCKQVLAVSPVF